MPPPVRQSVRSPPPLTHGLSPPRVLRAERFGQLGRRGADRLGAEGAQPGRRGRLVAGGGPYGGVRLAEGGHRSDDVGRLVREVDQLWVAQRCRDGCALVVVGPTTDLGLLPPAVRTPGGARAVDVGGAVVTLSAGGAV